MPFMFKRIQCICYINHICRNQPDAYKIGHGKMVDDHGTLTIKTEVINNISVQGCILLCILLYLFEISNIMYDTKGWSVKLFLKYYL